MATLNKLGELLYGLLFVVVVPVLLFWWSDSVTVPFPTLEYPLAGAAISGIGIGILIAGVLTIMIRGKGLPMNAFPPEKLVTSGIYKLVPHPIYVGFVLLCLGVSLLYGSATGFWLTTPLVALSCTALVFGHERHYLINTFHDTAHPILDFAVLMSAVNRFLQTDRLWKFLLSRTEKAANSWHERRYGPIRIISHGIYGGLAGGIGLFGVTLLCGPSHWLSIGLLLISGIIGAALWAQLLEGSSLLLRPFGYYGGVLGLIVGAVIISFFRNDIVLVVSAWGAIAGAIQAVGRVRCIIQGCCHGKKAPAAKGIVVTNEHSRVCGISELKGVPIYPTQLYSIVGNGLATIVLVLLWTLHVQHSLIIGLYFVLSGIVRFIEEGYRGEAQTKIIARLPIYQWLAIISVVTGMLIMLLTTGVTPGITFSFWPQATASGVIAFFICWFAYGMDFPNSNVIFSRLSG